MTDITTRGEKAKLWMATAALKAVAMLPLPVLYGISNFICLVLTHILHYRDKVITQNLVTSFPEKSPDELKAIKRGFYRHLSDVIVETIKLMHISDRTLARHIKVEGTDLVVKHADMGHPVFLMLGHYGNWEWVPYLTDNFPTDIGGYHVYKPLRSKVSDVLFLRLRGRFRSVGIPQDNVVRTILAMTRENPRFMVGFIADHRSNSPVAHTHVDFLSHSTPVHVAAETLGSKIGATYLYLDVEKTSRGHYRLTFKELDTRSDNDPMPVTRGYFAMLEKTIRRDPTLWLWSHRRWLYK